MNVLWLVPYIKTAPGNRFRVEQYLPWLAAHGVSCRVRPFTGPTLHRLLYEPGHIVQKAALTGVEIIRRLADVVRAARADVIVVHREALPIGTAALERLVARVCPALVFDFDDAIYLDNGTAVNRWARIFKRGDKTAAIIACSAQVIAGNEVLAEYACRYNPNVTIIPTPVDTETFRPRTVRPPGPVVIGWMGSPTTAPYLASIQRPLETLLARYPQVVVRAIGAREVPLRLDRLVVQPWTQERELDELRGFDIGIMPMPDNLWTQGKCGFKALIYMSMGLPVVLSPVGVNRAIVRDGETGFFAASETEWTTRLAQLIEDTTLRERMGRNGRSVVEREFSVDVQAPRLLGVLRAAAAVGRSRASSDRARRVQDDGRILPGGQEPERFETAGATSAQIISPAR